MSKSNPINASHWVLIIALIFAAFASFQLIQPYVHSIVIAFIISLLLYPIHCKIESKLPNNRNTAAVLSCLLLTFIVVLPLLGVFAAIIQQGSVFTQSLFIWVSEGGVNSIFESGLIENILAFVNGYLPFAEINIETVTQQVTGFASSFASNLVAVSAKIVGDATGFVMNFLLMLFVLFFLLRDHNQIIATLRHILPFSRSQEDLLFDEIEKVSKSAVLGSFLTAVAQGIAGGFGMWMAGFPGLFWGSMMAFASFIPVVGTALIWLPAVSYLVLIGDYTWAGVLLIWSISVVGSIDNLLRPLLMQGSAGMNTLMIFFSLLGGIHLFGLAGLIYGPLIFAITIVLFKMYEVEFADFLANQDNS